MKNFRSLTYLFLASLLLTACREDATDLDLNFKIQYEDNPLVMFEEVTYPSGEKLNFSRFSFYLSNVTLINDAGDELMLKEIDYLNFTNQNIDAAGASEGIGLNFLDIPHSGYNRLLFTIGVSPVYNAMQPKDFPNSNPLSNAGEYWPGWSSYVFTKTEGQIKLMNSADTPFSLHTGSDEALVSVLLDIDGFEGKSQRNIDVFIDLYDYFNGEKIYDMAANPQIHSLSQQPQVIELTNNLRNSISFEMR